MPSRYATGFDGDELLARPRIELITVGTKAIREAETRIAGCERCRGDEAQLPFDWILADVLNKRGPYEFVMADVAYCQNCLVVIAEKTLVEAAGGRCGSHVVTFCVPE